ncbi:MAG: LptF/LptG family permease [Candidatus Paceibacterota bacterium]|jgi:lipopolysaccharide export system permease protein
MIFKRYVAAKFWGPFAFGMGIFSALAFLGDIFDHMNQLAKSAAPASVVFKYFAYSVPFWSLMIMPVAALLAALFVLSEMVSSGEWTAAVASGYKPRQVAAPVLLCCALVALGHFALTETVSPSLRTAAERIFERDIAGNSAYQTGRKSNIVVRVADDTFLSAGTFDAEKGEMKGVSLSVQRDGLVSSQSQAQSASWDDVQEQWILHDGVKRTITPSGEVYEEQFAGFPSEIDIEPSLLNVEKIWPEDITVSELSRRIAVLKRIGSPFTREQVFYHAKLAAPFFNFILCLVAAPFAVKVKRGGKMLHFAAAITLAFFFWWMNSISQSAGEAGMLPPVLAGWLPVAVFGSAGVFIAKKAGL